MAREIEQLQATADQKVFTTSTNYVPGKVAVYVGGRRVFKGDGVWQFEETGANEITLGDYWTFLEGDELILDYEGA